MTKVKLTLFHFCTYFFNDCLICICVHYRDWQTGKKKIKKSTEVNRWWTIESIEHDNCSWWYELNLTLFSLFHLHILIEKEKIRASCYLLCKYVCMYVWIQHHQIEHRLEMAYMKVLFFWKEICCINYIDRL